MNGAKGCSKVINKSGLGSLTSEEVHALSSADIITSPIPRIPRFDLDMDPEA